MTKWNKIDTSQSELPDEEDESLNQDQADEETEDDVELNFEDDVTEDEELDLSDEETSEEPEEKQPPKKEEKPSRSQERIRELVAKQRKAEEEANLWKRKFAEAETEKQNLKKQGRATEKASVESDINRIAANIESSQRLLKQALEANDIDNILKYQANLTRLEVEQMAMNSMKKNLDTEQEETPEPKKTERQSANKIPAVVRNWKSKNEWFDKDPVLTGAALGINQKLIEEGYDPMSEEFYDEIDKQMAKFLGKDKAKEQPPKRKSPPVGESSKASPSTKVQVTEQDKRFAHKMGISPKEYLKQKANYELNNTRGVETYKPIFIPKGDK